MERIRSHSEEIARLYDTYGEMLFRLACSILLNRADAEDAVQDMFLKIFGKVPEFQKESQEKAWLTKVLVNQCRDSLKRRKLRLYAPLEEVQEILK